MKTKSMITALLLFLVGSFYSCSSKNELDVDCYLLYKFCPCENDPITTIQGEILFENQNCQTHVPFSGVDPERHRPNERLIFNGVTNSLVLTDDNLNMSKLCSLNGRATFNICNFPEFAEQWNSGITVYFEGIVYPHCEQFSCRGICYSLILIKLKKAE